MRMENSRTYKGCSILKVRVHLGSEPVVTLIGDAYNFLFGTAHRPLAGDFVICFHWSMLSQRVVRRLIVINMPCAQLQKQVYKDILTLHSVPASTWAISRCK
jgi:hypothetical protein